jgi:hypothetical protein
MMLIKKQVDISQEHVLQLSANQRIKNIKDVLVESGVFMGGNNKQATRKKLFQLHMQCIKDGDDCFGA